MNPRRLATIVALLAAPAVVSVAHGRLLLSTNDNKVTLVNGGVFGGTVRDTGVRIAVKGGPAALRTADK